MFIGSRRSLAAIAAPGLLDALFSQGVGVLPNTLMLKRLRTDYPEFAVYMPITSDGITWGRWYFTNRLNTGNSGQPRLIRCSKAQLYATTAVASNTQNSSTGTQAQSPTATQGTSGGSRTGTFVGPATVSGVTDVIYSTTVGDITTYTVTSARRIVWRTLFNSANGGIAKITVKDAGVEVDASYYTIPLSGSERLIDLRNTAATNAGFITLADDLPSGTYTIDIEVASTNPASGRVYDGGIYTYALTAYNSTGRLGTWETRTVASASIPMTFWGGAVSIYAFTGTRVDWRYAKASNCGKIDARVYNNSGVEIDAGDYDIASNEVDSYGASTVLTQTKIASGLTYGTYYLKIETKPTKNASSTGYRVYDNGLYAINEGASGTVGTDAFDDMGITDQVSETTVAQTLIGTGNLENAIKVRKTTDAGGTEDFVGGTHGYEGAPAGFTVTGDGNAIDYAGGAAGATWLASSFVISFSTQLQFPSDASDFADAAFTYTLDKSGYRADVTRTLDANAVIYEDYCLMLNAPSTEAGGEGANVGGGYKFFVAEPDTAQSRTFEAFDNSATNLGYRAKTVGFWNAQYAAMAQQLNEPVITRQYSGSSFVGAAASSFVQDRADNFVKVYNRAWTVTTGVTVSAGDSYTHSKKYRVRSGPIVLSV